MSTKNIEVVSYNPQWPQQFEIEVKLISQCLGENCVAIHHIGSTSVPGLAAKPRIDIIAVIKNTENLINNLESIGYQYKGEYNIPFHFGFSKREVTQVNLHVYLEGNPEIELNLLFRDYLRTHPEALNEYAHLKAYLLAQPTSFEKNNSMFTGYNLGKDTFIRKILQKAGFDKLRMHHCTHYDEWEAAKVFRQKYFFDKISVTDPNTWTFNHPEHVHLILSRGTKIIGYAHLQLWPKEKAVMRMFVIDEPFRNQSFGGQFLILLEKWLKAKEYKILHTVFSHNSALFFKKHGYKEMLFNDPDEHKNSPQNIAMEKFL